MDSDIFTAFFSGALFGISAGIAPGPLLTLALSHTLRYGVKDGYKVAFAPLMTDLPIIALALFCITKLAQIDTALACISVAGGCFVIYLAWESWRASAPQTALTADEAKSLRKGFVVNLLNPHPYLFWFSVGVPYMLRSQAKSSTAAAMFAIGFYIFIIGSKAILVHLVGRSRGIISNTLYINIMRILSILLTIFAAMLFYEAYRLWVE